LALAQDFLSFDLNKDLKSVFHGEKTEISFLDYDYDYELNDEELEKIISSKINQKYWFYKVKKGDTLWSLSKKI